MSPRIGLDLHTILQSAAEIADEKGLNEVTLASLSQKLGIRSPSLYNHVDGLSGLKLKLAFHGLKNLYEKLMRAAVGRSGDEAVLSVGRAYIEFARLHPGLYEATLSSQHGSEDADLNMVSEEIVQLMIDIMQAYNVEKDIAIHMVRGLRSILHGFASLERVGGFGLPVNLDDSVEMVLRTYLSGFRHSNKPES
ncbi:MAG: WHG domain-containing protein [Candidatus Pristimantibacillus sp.]